MSHDWPPMHLSQEQVRTLVQRVAYELNAAQFHTAGEILEGSERDARVAGEMERRIKRIWDAVPQRVRDDYMQALRKEAADELRAKADKIERGEQV